MTGEEIIAEARLNFGETTALSLEDEDFEQWVNTALLELYDLLPPGELLPLAQTTTVTITDDEGDLPDDLDLLLDVSDGVVPVFEVPATSLATIDANPYLVPYVPVYASDGEHLWVRGIENDEVRLTYVAVPDPIEDFTEEVVLPKWHAALVLFVTAFAYAQEEDKGQAQHYRNEALALINRTAVVPEQEPLE